MQGLEYLVPDVRGAGSHLVRGVELLGVLFALGHPPTRALRLPATSASVAFSPYLPELGLVRELRAVGMGTVRAGGSWEKSVGDLERDARAGREATNAYRLRLSALLRRHLRWPEGRTNSMTLRVRFAGRAPPV